MDIRPDPERPRGGFAELSLPVSDLPGEPPTEVAVYNSYLQKWLGPGGWQPSRAMIALRQVRQDGERLIMIVGPDVVNHIEEDTPVRIELNGAPFDTYWPDTINEGPDVAFQGDMGAAGAAPVAEGPKLARMPKPQAPPPQEHPLAETPPEDETTETGEGPDDDGNDPDRDTGEALPPKRKASIIPVILGGLVLLAIGGGYWFYTSRLLPPDPVRPALAPLAVPGSEGQGSACGADRLAAQSGDFAAMAQTIKGCAGELSPDLALTLIERAAASGDADALTLFGAFYDGDVTDEAIEGQIGLTFADNPARAAEYYARAGQAGSSVAAERLARVCERLALDSGTLAQGAHDDYCQ